MVTPGIAALAEMAGEMTTKVSVRNDNEAGRTEVFMESGSCGKDGTMR
jgi:hypothetical protein